MTGGLGRGLGRTGEPILLRATHFLQRRLPLQGFASRGLRFLVGQHHWKSAPSVPRGRAGIMGQQSLG